MKNSTTIATELEKKEPNLDTIKSLLPKLNKAELNLLDENQKGLLHHAACHKDPEIIKMLLRTEIDINQLTGDDAQINALHIAIENTNNEVAKCLIYAGIDVHKKNKKLNTPIQRALFLNNTDIALALGVKTKTSFIEFPKDDKRNDAEKALYNYFYTRFVYKLIIFIIFICILAIIGFSAATPSIKITINLFNIILLATALIALKVIKLAIAYYIYNEYPKTSDEIATKPASQDSMTSATNLANSKPTMQAVNEQGGGISNARDGGRSFTT